MMFDTTFFGYGVGLVILGWILGIIVNAAFGILKKIGLISIAFLVCFSSVSVSQSEAFNLTVPAGTCPSSDVAWSKSFDLDLLITGVSENSNTCIVSTMNETVEVAKPDTGNYINKRIKAFADVDGSLYLTHTCTGVDVAVIACNESSSDYMDKTTANQIVSFFLGGLVGFAFVYTADSKIFL